MSLSGCGMLPSSDAGRVPAAPRPRQRLVKCCVFVGLFMGFLFFNQHHLLCSALILFYNFHFSASSSYLFTHQDNFFGNYLKAFPLDFSTYLKSYFKIFVWYVQHLCHSGPISISWLLFSLTVAHTSLFLECLIISCLCAGHCK